MRKSLGLKVFGIYKTYFLDFFLNFFLKVHKGLATVAIEQ
jgi:hypothetical protein